jgi:hypothetical protein
MHFDFSSVDDVESFVSVPEGVHRCRVAEVREGRARDGSVRWSFRLEVLDGDYAGRTAAWDSITWSERGVFRVKKILEALGLDVRGELEIEPRDLVSLRASVKVEPEEREDPLTGRRQVRMRVPYLGYASLGRLDGREERDDSGAAAGTAGRNGAERSPPASRATSSASNGAASPDGEDESLAPVDGWGERRDALPRDGAQSTQEGDGPSESGAHDTFVF